MGKGEETWREVSSIDEASRVVGCIYRRAGKVAQKASAIYSLVCIDERGVAGYQGNYQKTNFYLCDRSISSIDPSIVTPAAELMLRVGTVTLDFEVITVCIPQAYHQNIKPSSAGTLLKKYARGFSALPPLYQIDHVEQLRGLPNSFLHSKISQPTCSLLST